MNRQLVKRLRQETSPTVARIPKTCKSTLGSDLRRRCLLDPQEASIFAGVCAGLGKLRLVVSMESSTLFVLHIQQCAAHCAAHFVRKGSLHLEWTEPLFG